MRSLQPQLPAKEGIIAQLGPVAVVITITALLLAFLAALMEIPAAAASNMSIEAMAIDLKPEYEARDVTVAYSVQLTNKGAQAQSTQLTLPVPTGSRLQGVYQITKEGNPEIPGASISDNGQSAALGFATPELKPGQSFTAYAIYTWNGIQYKGKTRSITFSFQAPFSVPMAVLKVTEPAGSTNMLINPEPAFRMGEETVVDILPIDGVKPGQTLSLELTYNRQGKGLAGNSSSIMLIVFGGIMVAALGFLLWRGTKGPAANR